MILLTPDEVALLDDVNVTPPLSLADADADAVLPELRDAAEEWRRRGFAHLAGRIEALLRRIEVSP